jgi:hypothetical protein
MPKRTKKDINSTSSEQMSNETVSADAGVQKQAADPPKTRKRSTKVSAGKTAAALAKNAASSAVLENDDLDLQNLLLQVDQMLTEMTQSKWLSSEWPSLEIDFGPDGSIKK